MSVESFTGFIAGLNSSNPTTSDPRSEGDDHFRGTKATMKTQFTGGGTGLTGAVTVTHTEMNYLGGVTSAIQTQLNAKVGTSDALLKGQRRLIKTIAASGATDVQFVNGSAGVVLDSTYDVYIVEIIQASPGTGATSMYLRTSTNAGSSFDSAASDYIIGYRQVRSGTATAGGGTGAAQISLVGGQTLATTSWLNAQIMVYKPSATQRCAVDADIVLYDNSSVLTSIHMSGMRDTAASDVDALQIIMSSGTISGTFNLYGIVK